MNRQMMDFLEKSAAALRTWLEENGETVMGVLASVVVSLDELRVHELGRFIQVDSRLVSVLHDRPPLWHERQHLYHLRQGDPTFLPTYAAAKNAMLSLTRLTAKDLLIANSTPMQCEQSPGNMGNMVAFLASDEARNAPRPDDKPQRRNVPGLKER